MEPDQPIETLTEQITEPKHVCGLCQTEFATEGDYLAHTCAVSQATPTEAAHAAAASGMSVDDYTAVQQAALERGEARQADIDAGQPDPAVQAIDEAINNPES